MWLTDGTHIFTRDGFRGGCWHVSPSREPTYIELQMQIVHNTSDFPPSFNKYPVNKAAPVSCFFVYPATLELTMVKLIEKPKPWK